MDEEIWKDIEGFEGLYQISDKGRVKSLEKTYTDRNGATRHKDEKILNPYPNKRGYMRLQLFGEKRVEWKLVHRLVAEAFLPNPDNLPIINHKDETPFHNNVENLEYCTQKYNVNYGTGIQRRAEKESKIVYQYTLDGQLVKIWKSIAECVKNGFKGAWLCCSGRSKTCKGFRWSYTPLEAPND